MEGATRMSDGKAQLTAEALLEAARRHQRAEVRAASDPDSGAEADALATDFVLSLTS